MERSDSNPLEDHRVKAWVLAAHLRDHPSTPLPLPLRDWLLSGIGRHLATGEELSRALGLRLPGRESAAAAYRRSLRNEALREAAALVGGNLAELAREIFRFGRGPWPRWKRTTAPPVDASPLQAALFDAFQAADCDASAGDAKAIAYVRGDFVSGRLTIGTGHTAASIAEGMRFKGIFLVDAIAAAA
jgi:hypothetical protein